VHHQGPQITIDGTAGTVRIEARSIPRKNDQGKKLALVRVWYFSVSYTW